MTSNSHSTLSDAEVAQWAAVAQQAAADKVQTAARRKLAKFAAKNLTAAGENFTSSAIFRARPGRWNFAGRSRK